MARTVSLPPFPDSPGAWLAHYRYRGRTQAGFVLSAEHLGAMFGASGATVRRWEAGTAQPTETDIIHVSDILGLKPIETMFLLTAFKAIDSEPPPDRDYFRSWASDVLSSELPAYIFDSLFYIRASNNYRSILSEPQYERIPGGIILAPLLRNANLGTADVQLEGRIRRWIRDLWSSTAHLCGSKSYRAVLSDLREIEGFEERWRNVALHPADYLDEPVGSPYRFCVPELGDYLVVTTAVTLPPVYYLRQYIPMNDVAHQRLAFARDRGVTRILFTLEHHWSQAEHESVMIPTRPGSPF